MYVYNLHTYTYVCIQCTHCYITCICVVTRVNFFMKIKISLESCLFTNMIVTPVKTTKTMLIMQTNMISTDPIPKKQSVKVKPVLLSRCLVRIHVVMGKCVYLLASYKKLVTVCTVHRVYSDREGHKAQNYPVHVCIYIHSYIVNSEIINLKINLLIKYDQYICLMYQPFTVFHLSTFLQVLVNILDLLYIALSSNFSH